MNNRELPVNRLIMVGRGGVGKTALTLRYLYEEFVEDYEPTKSDCYQKTVTFNDRRELLDILDTAGQEDYAAIRDNYFRTGEGFMCVFAIDDIESFRAMADFKEIIERVKNPSPNQRIPTLLVGNKSDLESQREVSKAEAEKLANDWACDYMETSAKSTSNVEEAYMKLFLDIVHSKEAAKPADSPPPDDAHKTKKKHRKRRCSIL